jgi:hypothetical protein
MLPPNEEKSPDDDPAVREISPPYELEAPVSKRMLPGFDPLAALEVEMPTLPLLPVLEEPVSKRMSPLLPNLDGLVEIDT